MIVLSPLKWYPRWEEWIFINVTLWKEQQWAHYRSLSAAAAAAATKQDSSSLCCLLQPQLNFFLCLGTVTCRGPDGLRSPTGAVSNAYCSIVSFSNASFPRSSGSSYSTVGPVGFPSITCLLSQFIFYMLMIYIMNTVYSFLFAV